MFLTFDNTLKNLTIIRLSKHLIKQHEAAIKNHFAIYCREPKSLPKPSFISSLMFPIIEGYFIPDDIKITFKNTIRFLELEMYAWVDNKTYLLEKCGGANFVESLSWTATCKIDDAKTVDNILKNKNIKVYTRLSLCCLYCRKRSFNHLWRRMPEKYKDYDFKMKDQEKFGNWRDSVRDYFTGRDDLNDDFCSLYLSEAGGEENLLALKFFMSKLSIEYRTTMFDLNSLDCMNVDNVEYFYNQMVPECKQAFLNAYSARYLKALLNNWPWHNRFFTELASYERTLYADDLQCFFSSLISKIRDYPTNDTPRRMLREFWFHYSKIILAEEFLRDNALALFELLETGDRTSLDLILDDMTEVDRKELLQYSRLIMIMISENRFDQVDYLEKRILTTEEEVERFKKRTVWEFSFFYNLLNFDSFFSADSLEVVKKFVTWSGAHAQDATNILKAYLFVERDFLLSKMIQTGRWRLFLECLKYFNLPPEEVSKFRLEVFENIPWDYFWQPCTKHGKEIEWDVLEAIIKHLYQFEVEVKAYKKKFFYSAKHQFFHLSLSNKALGETILNFYVSTPQDIDSYKRDLVVESGPAIVAELILENNLTAWDPFMKHVFASQEDVDAYKQQLFLTNDVIAIFYQLLSVMKWDQIKQAFLWFNPNKDTLQRSLLPIGSITNTM